MNYAEKLKSPKWQKKRLEILERDEWKCRICLRDSVPLHVHHRYYFRDKDPWDYDEGFLITLCKDCHGATQRENGALVDRILITKDVQDFMLIIMKFCMDNDIPTKIPLLVSQEVGKWRLEWMGEVLGDWWK